MFRRLFWIPLAGLLSLNACMMPDIKLYQPPEPESVLQSVAVLPFTLETQLDPNERPERIFRRVFYDYFSYLGYRDLPLEEVDRRLKEAGHTHPFLIQKLPPDELRRILGVDAVVVGQVKDANNFTAGVYAETRLEASLEMVDLAHNKRMWLLNHHEIDLSGILQDTLVDLVSDQVNNAETLDAYSRIAEAFAVKAIEEIPDPARRARDPLHPPVIHGIRANIHTEQVLSPGDVIEVVLLGQPGLSASFDIGSARTYLPMREVQPGRYQGAYRVREDDAIGHSLIIGRLRDDHGLTSKKVFRTVLPLVKV